MPSTDSHGKNAGGNYARYLYLGFTYILTLGILATGGYFVDRLLGTLPLFLLGGVGVGFAAGLYYVYRALRDLGSG